MTLTTPTKPEPPRHAPPPTTAARPAALWARAALAAAVLLASGGVRLWQGRRVAYELRAGRACPIRLADIPMTLGGWKGVDEAIDPLIAKNTGGTDLVTRTYTDERTGVRIGLILVYGPAADIFIHMPENCYPAAGYEPVPEQSGPRAVAVGDRKLAFNSLVFNKGQGGQADRKEVYYTWYWGGRWSPALPSLKQTERLPGMFKVHLDRRIGESEYRDAGNPCEDFLARLVPEMEARLAAAGRPAG